MADLQDQMATCDLVEPGVPISTKGLQVLPAQKHECNGSHVLRLQYLDGIRALAALWVVAHHAFVAVGDSRPRWMHLTDVLQFGHYAVTVFIVLSGYCLMMPVVRSGSWSLVGGVSNYFRRRAMRILPPYYGAMLLSLLMIVGLSAYRGSWSSVQENFTARALLSHLFLVQNLSSDEVFKINGTFWSIATEWQIYFFLPLLLLPLWRTLGIVVMLLVGHGVGFALLWCTGGRIFLACPWYIGMFSSGAAAAVVSFDSGQTATVCRVQMPWGILSALLWLVIALLSRNRFWCSGHWPQMDILVGIAAACLLVCCTRAVIKGLRLPILHVLEWRGFVFLGIISYSIYLTHVWAVTIVSIALEGRHWSPTILLIVTLAGTIPLSIGLGYGFFLLIEKRFLRRETMSKQKRQMVMIASIGTAGECSFEIP